MSIDGDVIVVGAGIAGAGAAVELSADRRVILLEQEERAGLHATGRSAALYSEIYGNVCIRALTQAIRPFFLDSAEDRPFVSERGCLHVATERQLAQLEEFAGQPNVASALSRLAAALVRGHAMPDDLAQRGLTNAIFAPARLRAAAALSMNNVMTN